MIIQVRPAGLGCSCNGACDACKRGMGDAVAPTVFDSILNALTTSLQVGSVAIPVWAMVAAGFFAVSAMGSGGRRR